VVTYVVFRGLDGYRSVVTIEDALADDVLIAEHLDGQPLDSDHGAPARLVSPNQYGYMSTKHLCRIEVHTAEPKPARALPISTVLFRPHPRARVWEEERNGSLPAWLVRPINRALKAPLLYLCTRGRGPG
jgi:DMSO/TMAO reductase YedYZ molybdopterin-dependent catalytic subunit